MWILALPSCPAQNGKLLPNRLPIEPLCRPPRTFNVVKGSRRVLFGSLSVFGHEA